MSSSGNRHLKGDISILVSDFLNKLTLVLEISLILAEFLHFFSFFGSYLLFAIIALLKLF